MAFILFAPVLTLVWIGWARGSFARIGILKFMISMEFEPMNWVAEFVVKIGVE